MGPAARKARTAKPSLKAKPSRATVRLIVWNAEEAAEKAAVLERAGYSVNRALPPGPVLFSELRRSPPDAVVIDLGRLPSQGRDVAVTIRHSASTRGIPIVFIEGDPSKMDKIRSLLPDACFTGWKSIRGALKKAAAQRLMDPVKPSSAFAAYAGTPTARKLGIYENTAVAAVGAPHSFRQSLGELPEGAGISDVDYEDLGSRYRLCVWFPRSLAELRKHIGPMKDAVRTLCIAWPKKASGVQTDLTQKTVRAAGLTADWVDYKIVSIDSTWSALLFARRKSK
jgi:CheY-like chemotaxis protein